MKYMNHLFIAESHVNISSPLINLSLIKFVCKVDHVEIWILLFRVAILEIYLHPSNHLKYSFNLLVKFTSIIWHHKNYSFDIYIYVLARS